MKKNFFVILFFILLGGLNVSATGNDLQKIYLEGGYTEAHKAIKESENYFKQEITLPTRIPATPFTHHFGRFSTLGSPTLEVRFLNENNGNSHFKINITSLEHKQIFDSKEKTQKLKLADDSDAIYYNDDNFHMFIFEYNNFQYRIMTDKTINKETLLSIANSIPH